MTKNDRPLKTTKFAIIYAKEGNGRPLKSGQIRINCAESDNISKFTATEIIRPRSNLRQENYIMS